MWLWQEAGCSIRVRLQGVEEKTFLFPLEIEFVTKLVLETHDKSENVIFPSKHSHVR